MTAVSEQMRDMWFRSDHVRDGEEAAEGRDFPDMAEEAPRNVQEPNVQEPDAVVADAATASSYAAARLLEIAGGNADALVDEARGTADRILSQARARAEEMTRRSSAEAKAREEAVNSWAEEQRVELDRARGQALRDLEERRAELQAKVNRLVEFEGQYRSQLISDLSCQLETLRGPTIEETTAEVLGRPQS